MRIAFGITSFCTRSGDLDTSDIVRGKRGSSKEHAKALGEFFHVSPSLFI